MIDEKIFKAYDIRGIYKEQFDEEAAWKIGYASAQFLRSHLRGYDRGQENAQAVCVGRDMRKHSPSLSKALIEGMRCAGTNVIDIGVIDTPQMYFAINHFGTCGGVQVTASHNPAAYNGFKISGLEAKPVGQATGLADIKHIATSLLHTKGNPTGTVTEVDLTEEYKKHILKFLDSKIKPLKVAVDASNGMAGKMVPLIFGDLPIELKILNETTDGTFKHEPNPLVEENLAELKELIKAEKADVGVCFDGDADRLLMIDETGRSIGCDILTALMVPYFLEQENGSRTVVYDLRSSWVVQEEIIKSGGTPRRERVGHSFMKKTLRDSHAVFGGELSGHFYYRDSFNTDSGMITFVHMLNILSRTEKTVSELIAPLRRYYASGELNFEVEDKEAMIKELKHKFADGKIDDLDGITIQFKGWWVNVRPSNTEPFLRLNMEAKSEDVLNEKLSVLKAILGEPSGH
ncbi:Phosphomannomutase/phosphoglucomutase [Sedimentisphaera cyanobacteriorum]|uniref:Phosphomannomutase/phosphoglucomutase n=1 Tax=Sedimentisphaera cyanobacteriorum TaxID=1940790 RepID=A0A1Q2HSR1_9BACT|nr:phosphomannomutase/phosphoglucomutase [Sedimentisphaera cyanobacteriorum]AQQ10275.1 Phosphomannomutase/phosphoglucomutase [Sedimentisphaera cyanobacteriorum]